MLLKLLKYDFRAMWKHFSLIWGAALALGLVNRLTHSLGFMARANDFEGSISNFTSTVLTVVFAVMFVLVASFVTRRFSKGLLGGEGYLMHTLPVRSWQLVLSKLICAIAACAASVVVALAALLLMFTTDLWELFGLHLWKNIFLAMREKPDVILLAAEFCLMTLSFMVQLIAAVYLAISIGHLFARHRRVIGVAAFIGLYVLLVNVYDRVFSANLTQQLMNAATSNVYGSLLTAAVTMLIPAAVFLAAVCWILEHKLNLE